MFNTYVKRGNGILEIGKECVSMSKGKSVVLGFLVGASVSAGVTLLSTPESGRQLRNRVKDQSMELGNLLYSLKEESLKLKNQLLRTSKEGAVLVRELTEEMRKSVEDWRDTVEPHQENIHQSLEQIESSIKELESKLNSSN